MWMETFAPISAVCYRVCDPHNVLAMFEQCSVQRHNLSSISCQRFSDMLRGCSTSSPEVGYASRAVVQFHLAVGQVKRTEGVSSTDIVGRMLMLVRTNNRFSEVCMHLNFLLMCMHSVQIGT